MSIVQEEKLKLISALLRSKGHKQVPKSNLRMLGKLALAHLSKQIPSKISDRKAMRAINLVLRHEKIIPWPSMVNKKKGDSFYLSREWRQLRYDVLRKYGGKCMLCGRSAKDGIVIHIDHIKPRARYPKLALDEDNLQVLCEDCNLGKSYKDQTDWR